MGAVFHGWMSEWVGGFLPEAHRFRRGQVSHQRLVSARKIRLFLAFLSLLVFEASRLRRGHLG